MEELGRQTLRDRLRIGGREFGAEVMDRGGSGGGSRGDSSRTAGGGKSGGRERRGARGAGRGGPSRRAGPPAPGLAPGAPGCLGQARPLRLKSKNLVGTAPLVDSQVV